MSFVQATSSHLLDVYKRIPRKLVRGLGSYVYDDEGEAFLDMYGGHAVVSLGHCHPRLVEALRTQLGKLMFYSNSIYLEHQEEAASLIAAQLPAGLDRVFFVNSGAEATENALKVARLATKRVKVLSFGGGFHGRTLGAQAVTGVAKYRGALADAVPGHVFATFGSIDAVADFLRVGDVAAVIVEPIQSLAGVRSASPEFFQELRRLCDAYGTLLIYDELQTGFGRTGSFSFAPRYDVAPDLIAFGKGMGGGFPVAACVVHERLAPSVQAGDLGTTFGGGPLAALAVKTTIEILLEEQIYAKVAAGSQRLMTALAPFPSVLEVRGAGYLLGLKLRGPASKLQAALLGEKVLTGTCDDPAVLRMMPPLTLTDAELEQFVQRFARAESVFHGDL